MVHDKTFPINTPLVSISKTKSRKKTTWSSGKYARRQEGREWELEPHTNLPIHTAALFVTSWVWANIFTLSLPSLHFALV